MRTPVIDRLAQASRDGIQVYGMLKHTAVMLLTEVRMHQPTWERPLRLHEIDGGTVAGVRVRIVSIG